ncbi:MAG: DEAD/DEAH box helicase, partial [Limnochordia bacterium]
MTLFNEMPDCTRRYESEQQILETHAAHIERMAHCWVAFYKSGQDFGTNTYTDRDFLDAYLAYYFSVNVPKVQLVLLDLARRGLLPNQLNVLDLGVGTGATAVGVLDFVVAWEEVCALYNQERPCGGVRLAGMDRSETALEYASKVVTAYGQALKARAEAMGESSTSSVPGWAVSAEWQQLNLNSEWPSPPFEPNVVFLMNTLNELNDTGRCRVAEYLSNLTEGTLVVAVEPGKEELARSLMGWRPELVSAGCFTSLAPCGEHSDLMHCERCWHMRRESMHQHRLYSAFVEACNRHIQSNTDRLDPFSNKLLSWSYFILRKEEPARLPSKHIRTSIRHGERLIEPTALRYIGSYRDREPVDDPPDNVKSAEYLKVCPSVFDNTEGLVVKREPGTQIPPLSYGQDFVIRNATVFASKVNGVFALIPDAETVFDSGRQTDKENVFLPEYSDETRAAVDAIAFRIFGFPSMRDFQHQTLARVLRGESILAIAATGGGKSECFILPAMLLPGVTIVVSSLKSLMADQYEQRIKKRFGLDHLATYINGDVSARERQHRLRR